MSIRVQFTEFGEPCGEGSVKLSSYLGPLVREHVPIVIDDWREIGEELKTVLWKSVKIRFELEGEYEKAAVMKQMGCLWRASKSSLVKEIRKAQNSVERMKLRPYNISTAEWRKFVKENTSQEFKAVSDSYKERRRKQIPHTCSRRGMVRLAEDLRQFSEVGEHSIPRSVNRKPQPKCIMSSWYGPKFKVAEGRILSSDHMDLVNNARLGPNSVKVLVETTIEGDIFLWRPTPNMSIIGEAVGETIAWPQDYVDAIEHELESEDIPPKSPTSINKCKLLHWRSNDDKPVAEGRWQTRDSKALVNGFPLGPNAIKVFVDSVNEPETFLWRPTEERSNLHDSLKSFVAWPCNRVLCEDLTEAPPTTSPRTQSQVHTPAAPVKSSKPLSQSSSGFSQYSSQ